MKMQEQEVKEYEILGSIFDIKAVDLTIAPRAYGRERAGYGLERAKPDFSEFSEPQLWLNVALTFKPVGVFASVPILYKGKRLTEEIAKRENFLYKIEQPYYHDRDEKQELVDLDEPRVVPFRIRGGLELLSELGDKVWPVWSIEAVADEALRDQKGAWISEAPPKLTIKTRSGGYSAEYLEQGGRQYNFVLNGFVGAESVNKLQRDVRAADLLHEQLDKIPDDMTMPTIPFTMPLIENVPLDVLAKFSYRR